MNFSKASDVKRVIVFPDGSVELKDKLNWTVNVELPKPNTDYALNARWRIFAINYFKSKGMKIERLHNINEQYLPKL